LDQTSTYKAINELQLFTDRYPHSSRLEDCNKHIDQLRGKLELKSYDTAEMYYDMESYKAAVTSYKILLHDFPSTSFREEVMFKIQKATFELAENSIEEKKSERYKESVTAYSEFISAYPESRFRGKADDIVATAKKRLDRMSVKFVQQNIQK
jgi:outer membrane protein assembly factor BamD